MLEALSFVDGLWANSFNVPAVVIIIILSCHQLGYPWPSLANPPYRSSLLAGPQGYPPYPHRAAVCRVELTTLLLHGHVKEPKGVHHLWVRPYFFSSVLRVWFISSSSKPSYVCPIFLGSAPLWPWSLDGHACFARHLLLRSSQEIYEDDWIENGVWHFIRSCGGIRRSTTLMSSSLLLQ